MKKTMDKLSNFLNINKKSIIFWIGILITGLICGSLFYILLNSKDKQFTEIYFSELITLIRNNKVNIIDTFKKTLIFNYLYIIIIWLLGISVIGLPLILSMFFGKCFTLGFIVSTIIKKYKIKGCLISFCYIFPHYIINIIIFLIITLYATILSIKMIKYIIKRKKLDFKPIMTKYSYVLMICLVGILLTSLYESFFMPKAFKIVLNLINI